MYSVTNLTRSGESGHVSKTVLKPFRRVARSDGSGRYLMFKPQQHDDVVLQDIPVTYRGND